MGIYRDCNGIDQQRQNVGRLQSCETALEEGAQGDWLAVLEMLPQKGLGQNKPTDSKKELDATVAVVDERRKIVAEVRRVESSAA
jgi:hypothetical protein